jgi:hypothetical protein
MTTETYSVTVCDGADFMGGCSRCGRAVTVGESGWTWHSWRREPGFIFGSVGSDDFYCPECSGDAEDYHAEYSDADAIETGARG